MTLRLLPAGLLLVLLLGGRASADAPADPAAVDAAIERAVTWILEEQRSDGTWGSGSRAVGHTALAVFALLHAGIEEDADGRRGKAWTRALRWLDGHGPGVTREGDREAGVYDTSLLMLIERARGRSDQPRMRRLVGLLESSQAENGQWSYRAGRAKRPAEVGDNSNAQFAVLALGAAVGEGLMVKDDVLRRAWTWWHRAARPDGGWGYSSGGSVSSQSTGSMTAAGIAALAILEAALAGRSPDVGDEGVPSSKRIERAHERLAKRFRVDHNFGPAQGGAGQRQRNAGRGWLHYFLWSVERAMVLSGQDRLGAHDWFTLGTNHLLSTQRNDGSWRGEHPLYATCFALLFLTRAADPPRAFTPSAKAEGPTTPGDGPVDETDPAPTELPPGTVVDWLKSDLKPDAMRDACLTQGASCLEPLVGALGHPDRKIRQRANELLRRLLDDARVGHADRHPLARGRLRLWVRQNARHLEVDEKRFVLP